MPKQDRSLKPHERQRLIWEILRTSDPLSISEIQQRLLQMQNLRLNRKTVERDLEQMSSKYGLTDDENHPKRYSAVMDSADRRIELKLNEEHLQVLSMGLTALKNYKSLRSLVDESEAALASALPADLKNKMVNHKQSWVLHIPSSGRRKEHSSTNTEQILKALRLGTIITGHYGPKPTADNLRRLEPVKIEIAGNSLAVLARDLDSEKKELKRFIPSRFSKISIDSEKAGSVSVKELEPFFATFGGFGGPGQKLESVRIVVGASVGEHLKEIEYHPSQVLKAIGRDRYQVTMKVPIGWPIVRLISSFGGDVFEIAPIRLKEMVMEIWDGGKRVVK